ncbi:MAG TPA: hypothetical protein VHO91_19835, partial [Rhodopila sp.]|nr:hypothetical protein [Rhodopila sp.]
GNKWTIQANGQIAVNGVTDTTTANVTELAYVNGEVWQENTSNLWWGKTSPTAAWSPDAGTATSPLPGSGTISQASTGTTVSLNNVSVSLGGSSKMLFVTGTGDTFNVTGGAQSIKATGKSNTFVLQAAGHGAETFTNNILSLGDKLDLRTALAATDWNGATSTLSSYLSASNSGTAKVLSIAPTAGAKGVAIATISGASGTSLNSLLTHTLT